ncbi:unnamed protein product, partial [Ectocarpus sp. 12 AP-2014]
LEIVIFRIVQKEATSEQWRRWLRVPLGPSGEWGRMLKMLEFLSVGKRETGSRTVSARPTERKKKRKK